MMMVQLTMMKRMILPTFDIDDDEAPDDWYFKGYLAFVLWGFIPAPGGEKYKSILMQGLGNDHKKSMEAHARTLGRIIKKDLMLTGSWTKEGKLKMKKISRIRI